MGKQLGEANSSEELGMVISAEVLYKPKNLTEKAPSLGGHDAIMQPSR